MYNDKDGYFLLQNEEQVGPFPLQRISQMLDAGELDGSALVWRDGLSDWISLSSIITGSNPGEVIPTVPPANSSTESALVELVCSRCGGKLDYISGSEVASCLFCGSAHLVRTGANSLSKLRDLEDEDLRVYYDKPVVSKDQAVHDIQETIRREKAGYKNPENLSMESNNIYAPAWLVKVHVECAWHGEYSEKRTITKWRKVTKNPGTKFEYKVDEPYNDTEIVWHPRSGSHVFEAKLWAPATSGFSLQQLLDIMTGSKGVGEVRGHPPLTEQMGVTSATKSQVQAWDEFECGSRIQKLAEKECVQCIERLLGVRSASTSKAFSLVYIPITVVSYEANGDSFRHFYNLKTRHFSGDLPLDEGQVRYECVISAAKQAVANAAKWSAATVVCIQLGIVGALMYNHHLDVIRPAWPIWLGIFIAGVCICYLEYNPWQKFKWNRRAYLLRILGNPPAYLKAKMHAGLNSDTLREKIAARAWNNTLENGVPERVHEATEHPARVLLRSANPLFAISVPSLLKVGVTVLLTTIFTLATHKLRFEGSAEKTPKNSASLTHKPAKPDGDVHSKAPQPQPKGNELTISDKDWEAASSKIPLSKAEEPVANGSMMRADSGSDTSNVKTSAQQNKSEVGAGSSDSVAIKLKLASLKGDLASVDSRIEVERKRWQDANAMINALTANRTRPVVRNSPDHAKMYEAQLAMKEVEEKAPQLKEEKAKIEATIKALEQELP